MGRENGFCFLPVLLTKRLLPGTITDIVKVSLNSFVQSLCQEVAMARYKSVSGVLFLFMAVLPIYPAITFTDDFERADGPLVDWVEVDPSAVIEAGQLALTPPDGTEGIAMMGKEGEFLYLDGIARIEFDISYPGDAFVWPFDHGGLIFCAQNPAGRYRTTCYVIDYIALDANTPEVGRFRMSEFVDGVEQPLIVVDDIVEYEGRWAVDITDTTVTFTFDGVEQFSVENSDLRSGYCGFWCYGSPAENKVTVDNLEIDIVSAACPVFGEDELVLTMSSGNQLLPVRIPFASNEIGSYELTVTSRDPSVAVPVGHTDGSVTMVFEAGASQFQLLEVEPLKEGNTEFFIEIEGTDCPDSVCPIMVWKDVTYTDDFNRPDGMLENWVESQATAVIEAEQLALTPGGAGQTGEAHAFAGQGRQGISFGYISSIEFDISYPGDPLDWPPDHGGVLFCCQNLNNRWGNSGYFIDYLDGNWRLNRAINGAHTQLAAAAGITDYEGHWKIELDSTTITFYLDDEEQLSVEDSSFRNGYVGFWVYTNTGQKMVLDNVQVVSASDPCPTISPLSATNHPVNTPTVFTVTAPFGSNLIEDFDVTVTSTNPEVALPAGAVDGQLVLSFLQGEGLTQTFEAECLSPGTVDFVLSAGGVTCPGSVASFTVREKGEESFCEDFTQADGAPENWTIFDGDWQILNNQLTIESLAGLANGEAWIWAGNPAPRFEGVGEISFTVDLSNDTGDVVGAHGGFMFFADAPGPDLLTYRWIMSGYEIDWIDRVTDRGYRMLRSDNGTHTIIAGPTFDLYDLGSDWRVEIDGSFIAFYVDEELIFEVEDATYREGHFGFWAYANGTVAEFDNLSVGQCGVSEELFIRGDVNVDDNVNIADAVSVLSYLFSADGTDPTCKDAADSNDDGAINIADAVKLLSFLFAGGTPPPAPFESCGVDPVPGGGEPDGLDCASYQFCE